MVKNEKTWHEMDIVKHGSRCGFLMEEDERPNRLFPEGQKYQIQLEVLKTGKFDEPVDRLHHSGCQR